MTGTFKAEQWLDAYGDDLFRFAVSRLKDEELAVDMVQETLLAAWRGRERFKGDSSPKTWLIGILKHKIVDYIRQDIRRRNISDALEHDPTSLFFSVDGEWQVEPHAWQTDLERSCDDLKFRMVFKECLARLPEKQQLVFDMRELQGEDSETICKACDISATHLHVLMYRARLALQACLHKHWFRGES